MDIDSSRDVKLTSRRFRTSVRLLFPRMEFLTPFVLILEPFRCGSLLEVHRFRGKYYNSGEREAIFSCTMLTNSSSGVPSFRLPSRRRKAIVPSSTSRLPTTNI